jgi:hypothetical protein
MKSENIKNKLLIFLIVILNFYAIGESSGPGTLAVPALNACALQQRYLRNVYYVYISINKL